MLQEILATFSENDATVVPFYKLLDMLSSENWPKNVLLLAWGNYEAHHSSCLLTLPKKNDMEAKKA